MLSDFAQEDLSQLLNSLKTIDIQEIYKKFRLSTATTKEQRIRNLIKYCKNQHTLFSSKSSKDLILKEIKHRIGNCIKLNSEFKDSFYNIYLLATFTNRSLANINDYFSSLLGLKVSFPEYDVQEYMVFQTRDEFIRYIDLLIISNNKILK